MQGLLFLLLPWLSYAASPEDPAWRALLHFAGKTSSVSEGSAFFLAPRGHEDAAAEWEATRKIFEEDPQAPCRFPARALYFGKRPEGEGELCERWERWRSAISARGIELVFASAFLDSPSSMYGHTLLKFPRGGSSEGAELLDYTLNYGAETEGAGGLSYVWQGLTGGFDGLYATAPFYLKVREYNHVENRDFWIYPLKVTAAELELLVAHAWELREVPFAYYFLRKNCSFYLLEFLEVARPGQNLNASFPFWAVPVDTIRRLSELGWLDEPHHRFSRRKRLEAMAENLSGEEKRLARSFAEGADLKPAPMPVLDAAYELWRYRTDGAASTPEEQKISSQLLKARAAGAPAPIPRPAREPEPLRGHASSRVSVAGGAGSHGPFGEISVRAALHDLLSDPTGYEPYSELAMGDFRFRFGKEFFLERFDLLRLRSLAPSDAWFSSKAWSFRLGATRAKELECRSWRCLHGALEGGLGRAFRVSAHGFFFILAGLDAEAGPAFDPNYRVSAGPSAGLFFWLGRDTRVLAEADWRLRLAGERRQRRPFRLSLAQDLSSSWELRLSAETNRGYREGFLGAAYFF